MKTVYLFGAGINRCIRDWDGLIPPLNSDLFKLALKHPRIGDESYVHASLMPLFEYIERYWKLSIDDLRKELFNLEDCFTLMQLQALEAEQKGDRDTWLGLSRLYYGLTAFLADYLSEFDTFIHSSEEFRTLGQILYSEKPTIITFNYDTLLESAIESASGIRTDLPITWLQQWSENSEISDDELPYSHLNWNRPLAYGVKFDWVSLQRPGESRVVPGTRFYLHPDNNLYRPPLLKLHGSLNWFRNTGHNILEGHPESKSNAGKEVKGQISIGHGVWRGAGALPPGFSNGWILEPILIAPTLYKVLDDRLFNQLWSQARDALAECRKLVVGGYSFPSTDFHTKRLFLESFSHNTLEELVVINPDPDIATTTKELCHFEKTVLEFKDVGEFIAGYV